jgi:hypothetical protein
MAFQVVLQDISVEKIRERLGNLGSVSEIFPMPDGRIGVSVPGKALASIDEQALRSKFAGLKYYDLYNGEWIEQK